MFFTDIHEILKDKLSEGLANHNPKHCIVCNPEASNSSSDLENGEDFHRPEKVSKYVQLHVLVLFYIHFYATKIKDLEGMLFWSYMYLAHCEIICLFMILNLVRTFVLYELDLVLFKIMSCPDHTFKNIQG